MFKLVKIQNSGANVPEVVVLPATTSKTYKVGSALTLSSGKAAHPSATTKPQYVGLTYLKTGSTSRLYAYRITPDMVFETPLTAAPTGLSVGQTLTLATDSNSNAYGVTATTEGGVATIVDLLGAQSAGDKILVRFD